MDYYALLWICLGVPLVLVIGFVAYVAIAVALSQNRAWRRFWAERSPLNNHLAENKRNPPTTFDTRYPHWCENCHMLVRYDEFYYERRDGDWGDYTAAIHKRCGTVELVRHHLNAWTFFRLLVDSSQDFAKMSHEQQEKLRSSFAVLHADLLVGKLSPIQRAEFEPLLISPNQPGLLEFLSRPEWLATKYPSRSVFRSEGDT